jgi:O-antigen/teichoic acid export membrane protein
MADFLLTDTLTRANKRSLKAKKNILASFIFKGGSIMCSFALVPLTLHYLDTTKYGIWVTLTSIVSWFSFFDIGLGNGLRYKLAEAIAKNDEKLAAQYVSTTYALLIFISLVLFILFNIVNPFIKWGYILNAPPSINSDLSLLALIVFGFFCLKFVLQLINIILTANQLPAINSFNNFMSNIISLVAIYLLTIFTQGSILFLGLIICLSPVVVLTIVSIFFFNNEYKNYKPTRINIDLSKIKELSGLGIQFFIIQISAIILFTTDNLIITQLYSPAEVTPYDIAYKYFGIILLLFSIINLPFWSAYTEAFQKNDIEWIRNIVKKLKRAWVVLTLLGLVLLVLSNIIYKIWVGSEINIPILLSIFMFIYVIEFNWGSIYVSFINGIGKIRLQMIFSIVTGILNIPLSIFFAKYLDLGISGIILATILCSFYGPIIGQIQFKMLLNKNAKGIWNM